MIFNQKNIHEKSISTYKWAFSNYCFLLFFLLLSTDYVQAQTAATSDYENESTALLSIQDESELTLPMAIKTALANNHAIKRALLTIKIADAQVQNAWAEVMPDINTNMNYTRNLEIPVNFVPAAFFGDTDSDELIPLAFGTDNNWQGGFTVSQNIFKGEALIGISTAELYRSASQEAHRGTAQQVVTQTRAAFYQVLYAEQNYDLQEKIIARLVENLRQNKARVNAGLLDNYEILRLEVSLANQRPLLEEARFAINQAYRNLSITMGLSADFTIPVKGNLATYELMNSVQNDPENVESGKINELVSIASSTPSIDVLDRSDINSLDIQRSLKIKETQAYKSRFLPTITADYAWQYTAAQPGTPNFFGNSNQRARFQTIGLNFSMPIFTGLSRAVAVQKAITERKDIELQKEEAKLNATAQILNLQEAFRKIKSTAEARAKALEQAKRGYEIAQSRYNEGLGTQLDVDEAEEQMQLAESNYAFMILEYLSTKAEYDLAIGKVPFVDLSPEDFN